MNGGALETKTTKRKTKKKKDQPTDPKKIDTAEKVYANKEGRKYTHVTLLGNLSHTQSRFRVFPLSFQQFLC